MSYFVMACHPRGYPVPIHDEEHEISLFSTREAAEIMAFRQPLCKAYGCEIYEWPLDGGAQTQEDEPVRGEGK